MALPTIVLASATAPAGLQTYTLADLVLAVRHALGKEADDTLTHAATLVNDALQWFAAQHNWSWRRTSLSLDLVAEQEFVNLPADFAAMHVLHMTGSGSIVQPSGLDEIVLLRAQSTMTPLSMSYYAVTWQGQAATNQLPTPRLELYPTPAADAAGGLMGVYFRTVRKLTGDAELPDIPAHLHTVLKQCCRAHAMAEEGQVEAAGELQLAVQMTRDAIAADGVAQPIVGQLRGTTQQLKGRYRYPHNVIGTL